MTLQVSAFVTPDSTKENTVKQRNIGILLAVALAFSTTACEVVAPALMGTSLGASAESEDKDLSQMDCTQLNAHNQSLRTTQTRLEAAARLTGADLYEIRAQFNELRSKVADAQALAGC